MGNNLFKKFLTYFYGSGLGLIIGILTTIVSTRILSPGDFGKFSMFTLAVNVLMIFIVFGTDQAFVRFFYEEKIELRNKLLFKSLIIPCFFLTFSLLLIFNFHNEIMMFLFNEYNQSIFFVFIISIIFNVLYRFSMLVIRMQQKGFLYSIIEVLNKLLNLLLLVLLYYLVGPSYEILILSTVFTLIPLTIISILLERSFWFNFNWRKEKTENNNFEILIFSYPLVLTTLITWLFQGFDKIALRNWSNFEELGLYSAAFRIVALLTVVQSTFSIFWAPVCYEHFQKNSKDIEFFSKTSANISMIMFGIAIITIFLKDFIIILLGNEYREAAYIMPFLIFMPLMYTISETTVIGINFYKKTKWHILIAVVACLANIFGNFMLVPHFGASGAAVSTGLAYILFFVLRTYISLYYYKVNYRMKRNYVMIFFLSIYAFQNTFWDFKSLNFSVGILLFLILYFMYRKELKELVLLLNKKLKLKNK